MAIPDPHDLILEEAIHRLAPPLQTMNLLHYDRDVTVSAHVDIKEPPGTGV